MPPNAKKLPNFNTVKVTVIEFHEHNGKRVAKLQPARVRIDKLFAGMDFDPATVIKNLRHLQSFDPRCEIRVHIRGQPPKKVPLNRVRFDPDNSLGDHPNLHVLPYGTIFQNHDCSLIPASAA